MPAIAHLTEGRRNFLLRSSSAPSAMTSLHRWQRRFSQVEPDSRGDCVTRRERVKRLITGTNDRLELQIHFRIGHCAYPCLLGGTVGSDRHPHSPISGRRASVARFPLPADGIERMLRRELTFTADPQGLAWPSGPLWEGVFPLKLPPGPPKSFGSIDECEVRANIRGPTRIEPG